MSFGGRAGPFLLLLVLRAPGIGGLRSGTAVEEDEDDDIIEDDEMEGRLVLLLVLVSLLFCLSPGRNNSFGSARVASLMD